MQSQDMPYGPVNIEISPDGIFRFINSLSLFRWKMCTHAIKKHLTPSPDPNVEFGSFLPIDKDQSNSPELFPMQSQSLGIVFVFD